MELAGGGSQPTGGTDTEERDKDTRITFLQVEVVGGENMYNCDACEKIGGATYQDTSPKCTIRRRRRIRGGENKTMGKRKDKGRRQCFNSTGTAPSPKLFPWKHC